MIDRIFDSIRWVTTRIDRAARAVFHAVFPGIYLVILLMTACGKAIWTTVGSFRKWPGLFADAWRMRDTWR